MHWNCLSTDYMTDTKPAKNKNTTGQTTQVCFQDAHNRYKVVFCGDETIPQTLFLSAKPH